MKKERATRADLLERFAALKIPAARFEREHGLPGQMIAGMRQGKYASPDAAELVAKFEAAIAGAEAPGGISVAALATPVAKNRVVKDEAAERELIARIEAADDPDKLQGLQRHILALRARDLVTDAFVRAATDSINRQVQLWKDKIEAQETARAGEPIVVRVEYVNRWTEDA